MTSNELQVSATLVGLIGTLLMFFNSHSLIPYESAMFGSDEIMEHDRLVEQKNKKMLLKQRIGIGLLTFSFVLQLCSYVI